MSVTSLIIDAYHSSTLVAQELEVVTGTQLFNGLKLLNQILNKPNAKAIKIPYTHSITFNTEAGKEEYSLPGLISVVALTFLLGSVHVPLDILSVSQYKNLGRIQGLKSVLSKAYVGRTEFGSTISFYPAPIQIYEINLTGVFFLNSVTFTTDIDSTLDQFYRDYLEHALAVSLCIYNRVPVPPDLRIDLASYEDSVSQIPGIDLSTRKVNIFKRNFGTASIARAAMFYEGELA